MHDISVHIAYAQMPLRNSHAEASSNVRIESEYDQEILRGGGLNAFYWYQIFALDSAADEAQHMLSSHGGFPTIAMYHHRETIY